MTSYSLSPPSVSSADRLAARAQRVLRCAEGRFSNTEVCRRDGPDAARTTSYLDARPHSTSKDCHETLVNVRYRTYPNHSHRYPVFDAWAFGWRASAHSST